MAFLAADGRLLRLEQVLTEQTIARISREHDRRRTRAPDRAALAQDRLREQAGRAWDYVLQDTGATRGLLVMVGRDGVVTEKVYVRRMLGESNLSK